MNKFEFRKGARYVNKDPEVVHGELEKIRAKHGVLTAELVVDAAKSKRNPLHKEFEWDDSKAAHEWRLHQGRRVIQGIVTIRKKGAPATRTYEITTTQAAHEKPAERVYQSLEDILADPVQRAELLQRAINEALAFRKRYYRLQELSQLIHVIDETLENVNL